MRKIYLLVAACLSLGAVQAQQNQDGPTKQNFKLNPNRSIHQLRNLSFGGSRCTQNVLESETFANPFSNGWTTDGAGSSGGTYSAADLWLYDTDGPNGFFSLPQEIITSSSASDGFMILDADYFNGLGGFPATVESYHAELISPVYDLSSVSNVTISFEHAYRLCCDPSQENLFVEVSTDGFSNVHGSWVVSNDVPMNDAPGTIKKYINITNAIQGNPSNVQIRFRFGIENSTGNASHYWWQLDDLTIFESYEHHAELDTVAWSDNASGYGTFGGFGKIPAHDAAVTTLDWSGYLKNLGSSNWTDAKLEVLENGNPFAQSASQNVPVDSYSNIFIASAQMASTIGTNTYSIFGTDTAQMCVMDTATYEIEVTQDAWSAGGSTITGIQSGSNWDWNTPPVRVGFGGEVNIITPSTEYIVGARWAMQDTSLNDFAPIEIIILVNGTEVQSTNVNVDPSLYGGYQHVSFSTPIPVQSDDVVDYLAVDSDGEARFYAAGSSNEQIGLLVTFDGANVMSGPFLESPILMEIIVCEDTAQCATLSIEENHQSIGSLDQNYPNPFDQNTVINFNLKSNETCLFEVRDVTGKLVKSLDLGIQSAGQHQIELNSNEFGEGIYFYTLYAGETSMTKKMIVLK